MRLCTHASRIATLGLALGALATFAGPIAAAADESGGLEEIVVTATRRDEALSKVPVSVTALSQETMDQRGVKDIEDVARFTPGVSIDDTGTNAISIRGISSSAGAGTTGIYIDETPIQMRSVGFNPDDALPRIFDLDRVEVLRGPQGTLFGSGSEGGTVRYLLAQPKVHGSSTYMRSEFGSTSGGDPSYEFGIAHGDTVVDGVFGWRASAWYRHDGGWIDRVDPTTRAVKERNADYGRTTLLRATALWQPNATFSLTPSVIYQDSRLNTESTYWAAYSNESAGHFANATPELQSVPDKYYLPALKLQFDLPHSQVIANTSYYHRDETTAYQGTVYALAYYQSMGWPDNPNTGGLACADTGELPVAPDTPCSWYPLLDANGIHMPAGLESYQSPDFVTNRQQGWTQEVRWQSTDRDSRWQWTLGAFWAQSKQYSLEEIRDSQVTSLLTTLYQLASPADVFGDYYRCNGQGTYDAIPDCTTYYNANSTTDRQSALFAEVNYALTDRLKLTVGERLAHFSFSLDHYADGMLNFGPDPATASQSETAHTPKLGLSFQKDNDNLFYATLAKGFRPGGGNAPLPPYCDTDLANAGFTNGAPLTYSSDSTQSFEVGSKNNFGRALRIATSAYYIRWDNIQQNVFIGGGCGLQFTSNLGTAVAQGFDLQLEMALHNFDVNFAAGYTDARYTRNTLLVSSGDAISGQASIENSPGLAPPWTVSVGAQYNFQLSALPAYVRLDYEMRTRNDWLSALQDPNSAQYNPPTYTLPGNSYASLHAGVTRNQWNLALFVDNLFDSRTVLNYQLAQIDPYNGMTPSVQENRYTFRPRTIGLTLSYHQ